MQMMWSRTPSSSARSRKSAIVHVPNDHHDGIWNLAKDSGQCFHEGEPVAEWDDMAERQDHWLILEAQHRPDSVPACPLELATPPWEFQPES